MSFLVLVLKVFDVTQRLDLVKVHEELQEVDET